MELQLQELDYWAIGVYILLMAGIGLSFGWFIKDVGAYFKGNGTIPCRDCLRVRVGLCYGILVHCTGMYHWQPVAWRTLAADWLRHSHRIFGTAL